MKTWILLLLFIGSAAADSTNLYMQYGTDAGYYLTTDALDANQTQPFSGFNEFGTPYSITGELKDQGVPNPTGDIPGDGPALTWIQAYNLTTNITGTGDVAQTSYLNLSITISKPLNADEVPAWGAGRSLEVSWILFRDSEEIVVGEVIETQAITMEKATMSWAFNYGGALDGALALQMKVEGPASQFRMGSSEEHGFSFLEFKLLPESVPEPEPSTTSTSSTASSSMSTTSSSSSSSAPTTATQAPTSNNTMEKGLETEDSPFPILASVLALAILVVRRRIS